MRLIILDRAGTTVVEGPSPVKKENYARLFMLLTQSNLINLWLRYELEYRPWYHSLWNALFTDSMLY